jgi:Acetyl/propionyl-CoA carboxylase, alpha subunit
MKKVLIANRGEIALRVVRACRDYGVKSVAVYADGDVNALFVRHADEAFALGGSTPKDTYLNIGKLIDIAKRSGADAVHPGYGFLSERAEFAEAVTAAGLTWIGPPADVIRALGDKLEARRIAARIGAPLARGSENAIDSAAEALAFAREIGVPVAIKAAHGGGGRGLKIAHDLAEVEELFESARREALAAFGRGECFIEQYLDRPRHIEAQVIADTCGNVVVVGTRDCSLQRRNQKLVEEAPAPFITEAQRAAIHESAAAICREVGYVGAGTVEYLLGASGVLSFLEVNTRLQVEHPVTEETAGIDLVVEQLRIADGLPLSISETPAPHGHAIEFRINAEDAGRGFLPASGEITRFDPPAGPGIRLDSGVEAGSIVPSTFDSLVAKLIVTGQTREQAIARARRALAEFRMEGVPTVLPFHRQVLEEADFVGPEFRVHTRWIETDFAAKLEAEARPKPARKPQTRRARVEIDGRMIEVEVPRAYWSVFGAGADDGLAATPEAASEDPGRVLAPMAGTLVAWRVESGTAVRENDVLGVMEAMKMETPILAGCDGIFSATVAAGSPVGAGDELGRIVSHSTQEPTPA